MKDSPEPAAGARDLVLELFRKRDPGALDAFDHRSNEYVRRREGDAPAEATFEWNEDLKYDLDSLFVLREERLAAEAKARRMGETLRRFLAPLGWDDTERQLAERLALRGDSGPPVQLTLRLGASELFALPWELVRFAGSETEIGRHEGVLLRYEQGGDARPRAQPLIEPPPEGGRVLFAWSDAGGDIDLPGHLEALAGALGLTTSEVEEGNRSIEVLPRATLEKLDATLKKRPAAVLHLLCHGAMQSYREDDHDKLCACLVLHDEDGRKATVTPPDLHRVMERHARSLRLVVLSVCRGGDRGDLDNTLGSPAQQVHRAGIPAVVAARHPLPLDDSIALTRALHEKMARECQSLEEAFLHARRSLRAHPFGWSSLQLFAREADGPDHRPIVPRPYRGFKRSGERDAMWYFGRSEEITQAVARLAKLVDSWATRGEDEEGDAGTSARPLPRFLVISGASGAGASAFVGAGVVPAWLRERSDTTTQVWRMVKVPDGKPSEAVLAETEAARGSKGQLLLWVDRLEGAFAAGVDPADRERVFRRLWALAGDKGSRVTVLATVRVDFLDRLGEIRIDAAERTLEEIARDRDHGLPLFRMKSAALREVVLGPAARAGIELEAGLCDRLLRDVGDSPGAQALLEYVLGLLWEKRSRRGARLAYALTHDAYTAIGGAAGALDRRADEVLGALDEVRQRAARRLLVQLVEVDAGGVDRRRRVARGALQRGPDDEAAVRDEVLAALSAAEIVVVDEVPEQDGQWGREGDEVELAHDELLRSWRRLRAWLDEDRKKKLAIQQVERWARELHEMPGATLEGPRLAWARAVVSDHAEEMLPEARALVERSIVAEEKAAREAAAAQQRELEHLRKNRSLWIINNARENLSLGEPGVAGLLLAEVAAPETSAPRGVFARVAREVLDAGIAMATLRHGAAVRCAAFVSVTRLVTGDESGALFLWRRESTPITLEPFKGPVTVLAADRWGRCFVAASRDGSARVEWMSERPPVTLEAHAGPICSVALDPEGRSVLTASTEGRIHVSSVDTGRVERTIADPDLARGLRSAAFSPDGQRIVAIDGEGGFFVWTRAGERVARWRAGSSAFACFSSERFLLGREDGEVWLVRADGGEPQVVDRHTDRVVSAVAAPDGLHAITVGAKEWTAALWRLDAASDACKLRRVLRGHDGVVVAAGFSPDGKRVVTGSLDGTAWIRRVDDSETPLVLRGHRGGVRPLAWSPDSGWLVTGSDDDRKALYWNIGGSRDPRVLRGHTAPATAIAWSPDGQRLATGSGDRTARVWSLEGERPPVVLSGHEGAVTAVAWSPDGQRVATGGEDRSARLWSAAGAGDPVVLAGHSSAVKAVAWSPDGQRVATGGEDGTVHLWKIDGEGPLNVFCEHAAAIASVAWSPDGGRLLTASADGTARVWLVDRPGEPALVLKHDKPLTGALFNQDGTRILTALAETGIRLWSADGQGPPRGIDAFRGPRCAAFSPHESGEHTALLGLFDDVAVCEMRDDSGTLVPLNWFVGLKRIARPVTAAAFSADLQQIATAAEDHTVHVCAIGASLLQQRLQEATVDTLQPDDRRFWLGETKDEAEARWAASEARRGRAPAPAAGRIQGT